MPNRLVQSRIIRVITGGISRRAATRAFVAAGVFAVLASVVMTLVASNTAIAAVGINKTINFQGKVVNSNGTNVTNGSYSFTFSLYTVSTGGSNVWTETKSITVTDGIFQTNLGSATTLPGSVDFNTDNIYLGIVFNGDPEMLPRIQFSASPYSFNSDLLDGKDASAFAQLNPSSAQSGSLNVTGSVQAGTSIQAPLVDTATAAALSVGTGTATSVTVGRATSSTNLTLQGSASTTWSATGASGSTTIGFVAPTAAVNYNFATAPAGTYTVCTTHAASCSATYQAVSATGYLLKDATDTSSIAGLAALAFGYTFSNTTTGPTSTSGVLRLQNNNNTGSTLLVTANATPSAGNAILKVNQLNAAATGNIIDLQLNGTSSLAVDTVGSITQVGGTATTSLINGQRISAAANFTGTVTVASTLTANGTVFVQAASTSTTAFNLKTPVSGTNGNMFTVDTVNGRVGINLGTSNLPATALEVGGGLRLSGTNMDSFTTPVGAGVNTKINIPLLDPGSFGQVLAFGLPSTAQSTSRAMSLFDARTTSHQPTLGVFSPDENSLVGFSWDGSNTTATLKTNDENSGSTDGVMVRSGEGSGTASSTGAVSLRSGDGTGTSTNSGGITVDSGSATGTAGNVSVGTGAYAHNTIIGNTTSTSSLTLQAGSGNIILGSGTLQRTAAGTTTMNLIDGSNTALAITNSGAGQANLTVDGGITALGGPVISSGTFQTADGTTSVSTTLRSGNASAGASGGLDFRTGNATGGNSGNLSLDTGTSSGGTTGQLYIGGTNASQLSIGRAGAKFFLQGLSGSSGSTITTTNSAGTNTVTAYFQDPTVNGSSYRFLSPSVASTTYNICTSDTASCGGATGTYVQLQAATPGTQQTGNINVSGKIIAAGGITVTSASSINLNTNAATDINTGTSTGLVSIGGGAGTFSLNTTNIDISAAGAVTGVTGYTQASGNATFNQTAADQFKIQATAAPTTDMSVITNTGFPIATDGINAQQIDYYANLGNAAHQASAARFNVTNTSTVAGATTNAVRLVVTANVASNSNALKIDNITSGAGTDTAVNVGTGWDNILSLGATPIISGAGYVQNAAFDTALSYTNLRSVGTFAATGNVTVGTVGANLFKNNGATQNVACAYTGVTGATTLNTAAKTPDVCTAFTIATTGTAAVTVPAPAAGAGSIVYLSNLSSSTSPFTLLGSSVGVGTTATLVYNGTAWTYAGADSSGLQTAYNNSAGAAPSIAMNTTNKALVLQSSATSGIAAGNELLGVRAAAANDTTLGASIMTVSTYGLGINMGDTVQNPVTTSTYDLQFGGSGSRTIAVASATAANAVGVALTVQAGAANGSSTGNTGGALSLKGGAAAGTGANAGGAATVQGGTASGTGTGGTASVLGGFGSGAAGASGGGVNIAGASGGNGLNAVGGGAAGAVTLQGGNGGAGTGTNSLGAAGATITLTAGSGGASTGTANNAAGGSISLVAGSAGSGGSGTAGIPGVVSIDTPVFVATTRPFTQTANNQTFNIPTSDIDSASTVVVNVGGAFTGATVTVPSPTNNTTGRIVYITNGPSSVPFTLSPSGSSVISMNTNSTATLVWNGSAWTAAGADASTSLQQVYNNTSTSPVSIVTSSVAKNILFQAGAGFDSNDVFQVTSSQGGNVLAIDTTNSGAGLNLAQNGGVETGGTPPTGWSAHGGAATPTQTLTAINVSGGVGALSQTTTAATHGARNALGGTTLANSTTYNVSFSAKVSVAMTNTNMVVEYYRNNTPTLDSTCSANNAVTNPALNTTAYIKYTCYFTTSATAKASTNFLAIRQADATARTIFIDNLSVVAQNSTGAQNTSALRVGGANSQGLTLLTVDSYAAAPYATGATINTDLLGSLYYDTTIGKLQCYEAKGWGSCGNSPNNSAFLIPEYPNAVLGARDASTAAGIGTMNAGVCSGSSRLNINTSLCGASEDFNYYSWTSPQASDQIYSIYVRYQLPATYNGFLDANTVKLVGRTTSTTNGSVIYRLFSATGSTSCGTIGGVASTTVTTANNTWQQVNLAADETSGAADCIFAANDIITYRIDMMAKNGATVYAANMTFTTKGL